MEKRKKKKAFSFGGRAKDWEAQLPKGPKLPITSSSSSLTFYSLAKIS
jgi:hypothetical protein